MTITKFGQCCLLIEINGKRVLTDPGRFSREQDELMDLDLILITHEHADHLHAESLQAILKNNPEAIVVTNSGVGEVLAKLEIEYTLLEDKESAELAGLYIEAYDGQHVEIFADYGQVQNTGYFVAEELFCPGDAYTNPEKEVPVLALPVSGPWCSSAEAMAYAIDINPGKAFPVHDYVLNEEGTSLIHGMFETILKEQDVEFISLKNNETKDF
ncbi:hypothetical protein CL653_00875 [bacterium]|nr:hypothetical protein [bacterium]